MLYVEVQRTGLARAISARVLADDERNNPYAETRNDWRTYEVAQEVATLLGPKYQATDAGPYVSPRYDIIELPQVGDDVSYGVNGDCYPCGKIKSISPGPAYRRIVAGPDFSGKDMVFYRRCRDGKPIGGAWIGKGVWSLVQGHINKRNLEF